MEATIQGMQPTIINTIDALWTLIQSQPRKVREELSARLAQYNTKNMITPEMAVQIRKAREEYSRGETIRCSTPEEMQKYFDSL